MRLTQATRLLRLARDPTLYDRYRPPTAYSQPCTKPLSLRAIRRDEQPGGRTAAALNGSAVVLGLGLNVLTRREELPREDATSLALAGATCTDRTTLLVALLRAVAEEYRDWLAACDTVGRRSGSHCRPDAR